MLMGLVLNCAFAMRQGWTGAGKRGRDAGINNK